VVRRLVMPIVLAGLWMLVNGSAQHAYAGHGFPHATVKVWDTAVPGPGLTPTESVEDPGGLTGHGTGSPTIVTLFARSTHSGGPSGVSYWNPDENLFVWYGKTFGLTQTYGTPASGFPAGVDINRGGGPVLAGGPVDPGSDGVLGTADDRPTSFGRGDVWVAGQQTEPLYVHIAGTDMFRSYGTDGSLTPPSGRAWGVAVDEASGNVFVAQPEEGRITRVVPPTGQVTKWDLPIACGGGGCGAPVYVTLDRAGRPYSTMALSDGILRVNPGRDGVLGTSDDTIDFWKVPSLDGRASFVDPPGSLTSVVQAEEHPHGIITTDAEGNIWFTETGSNEVGRLSGGPDRIIGTADDEICEFTTSGLENPRQIASGGSGNLLQAYFTEGGGNSVSVLTRAEADMAPFPMRVCTTTPPLNFAVPLFHVQTRMFDEKVVPRRATILPTVHDVPGLEALASGLTTTATGEPIPPILRFSPMPGGPLGNGVPSGMTSVYAGNRIAGAYLKGNKHFEVTSGAVIAPPPPGATTAAAGSAPAQSGPARPGPGLPGVVSAPAAGPGGVVLGGSPPGLR
jgi:hypothetical protein